MVRRMSITLLVACAVAACDRTAPTGPSPSFTQVLAGAIPPVRFAFSVSSHGMNVSSVPNSSIALNGRTIASTRERSMGRGFNVAAIDPGSGELIEPVKIFDTWGNRSSGSSMEAMVAFIDRLPTGTLLLVAVNDEAGLTSDSFGCIPNPTPNSICCRSNGFVWTEAGLRTLEALGAKEIRRYCYRNSYSLIAIKGVGAMAESLANGVAATTGFTLEIG